MIEIVKANWKIGLVCIITFITVLLICGKSEPAVAEPVQEQLTDEELLERF